MGSLIWIKTHSDNSYSTGDSDDDAPLTKIKASASRPTYGYRIASTSRALARARRRRPARAAAAAQPRDHARHSAVPARRRRQSAVLSGVAPAVAGKL